MPQSERFENLILGSGTSGKSLAWHLARSGQRTAVVERQWIGGACPNVACLPSKNEIRSAEVAHLARQGAQFGVITGPITTNMEIVSRPSPSRAEIRRREARLAGPSRDTT
jgi:pyruvate/2-oxoglutarate dehydrogenase complex dihydrolipoamide dehydrogenase (E3) component